MDSPELPDADPVIPKLVRNHRRFALTEVTLDGDPVGGATIDAWQNASGADCWAARVLMEPTDVPEAGSLAGRTTDGRMLRGQVSRGAIGPSPRSRGAALVEWHGIGTLATDAHTDDG
jgi:hypothetical protein